MKKSTLILASIAATFLAAHSHADSESGATLFGSLGQASYKNSGGSESDTSFAIGGGYRFNQNFALEARYDDFGKISDSATDSGLTASASVAASAMALSVKAGVPLSDMFSLYAKLGLSFWDVDTKFSASGFGESQSGSISMSGNDFHFGLGGEFNIADNILIGLEYSMLNIDDIDTDVNNLSLTASFNF